MRWILSLLFALYVLGLSAPASAQDTLLVKGVTLTPGDSLQAREVLHSTIGPTSEYWADQHEKPGNNQATNTFVSLAKIAYPLDYQQLNQAHVDSILTYLEAASSQHPNPGVRAEFLYEAVQISYQFERTAALEQYYDRLTSEYDTTVYAERAAEYAPDRPIRAGKPVPPFKLPALKGTAQAHTREDFEGHVLLIDFWGTWCGPCIGKMPQLHKAYRKYKEDGLEILSVAMHDERDDVRAFRSQKWKMPWKHAFISEGSAKEEEVISRFEVRSFPTPILVDENGTIIATSQEFGRKKLIDVLADAVGEQN
jgi:thiol-disulfide isomerase/thioredoxin